MINRPSRLLATTVALLTIAALAGACSGSGEDDDSGPTTNRSTALAEVADDVIVPGIKALADETATLSTAMEKLCSSPSVESMGKAQDAWRSARSAWMEITAFAFGPIDPLHSRAQIDYPIDTEKIEKLFAPGAPAAPNTPEDVEELGADVRGMGAIEYVLFSDGTQPDTGDITPSGRLDPSRCGFALAASRSVAAGAAKLHDAWVKGSDLYDSDRPFVDQFKHPGKDSMYSSEQEVIDDLVNGSLAALNVIGDMILGPASGKTTGKVDPTSSDPGAAHNALLDAVDVFVGVSKVYGESSDRLSALVAAQSESTDRSMREDLDAVRKTLGAIEPPLASLDTSDSTAVSKVVRAFEATSKARVAMRTEVASQLGVTISFSDADGDG